MTAPALPRRRPGKALAAELKAEPTVPVRFSHIDVVEPCVVDDEALARIADWLRDGAR